MVPRTMASAWFSLAWRRPKRDSTASRTAALISCVSVGSLVWLSNGSTATVLMEGGKPPPAKPYRQPVRMRELALARKPDVGRKRRPGAGEKGDVESRGDARHGQPGS